MNIDVRKLDSLLNKQKETLSKTEKKIHEYVLSNYDQVIYDSLNSIATKLDVGEASLVRYFRKLGYSSFNHFKMEIYNAVDSLRIQSDSPYVESITQNMFDVIKNTKESLDFKAIDEATEILLKSKHVFIAGMGISHTTALDMFSKLLRVGIPASVISDSHFSYMYSSILDGDNCAILYSFSGETVEMKKIASICKDKNVKVIVISNYNNSTLYQMADVFLKTSGFDNDIRGGFFTSKISQLYISDILATNCALQNVDRTKKYSKLVSESVMK